MNHNYRDQFDAIDATNLRDVKGRTRAEPDARTVTCYCNASQSDEFPVWYPCACDEPQP